MFSFFPYLFSRGLFRYSSNRTRASLTACVRLYCTDIPKINDRTHLQEYLCEVVLHGYLQDQWADPSERIFVWGCSAQISPRPMTGPIWKNICMRLFCTDISKTNDRTHLQDICRAWSKESCKLSYLSVKCANLTIFYCFMYHGEWYIHFPFIPTLFYVHVAHLCLHHVVMVDVTPLGSFTTKQKTNTTTKTNNLLWKENVLTGKLKIIQDMSEQYN